MRNVYDLPTTVTVGVSTTDAPTDATIPADLHTTEYGYDPIDGSSSTGDTSGWILDDPTVTTTVMPGTGNNIVHKTLFDTNGNPIETVAPLSNGSDAGTTKTITYTAGANSQDSACGNKPQWAGLPCWSGPAAAPGSGVDIVDQRATGYNIWLSPTEVVETSGSGSSLATRTTDVSYGTAEG